MMELILGHNQFIGISHLSEAKSEEENRYFSTPQRIMDVVEEAYAIGVRSMIVETHPRMLDFLRLYSEVATIDMKFILQIPNVSSYVRTMGTEGLEGIIFGILKEARPAVLIKSTFRSLKDLIQNKYANMGATGINLIASPYFDYEIKKIMIHNVITDLLLGLDMADVLMTVKRRIEGDRKVKVGFITLNLPLFEDAFRDYKEKMDIMTPINPLGYDMNPTREDVEHRVRQSKNHIMAMNVLGGGSIPIRDAVSYIKGLGVIDECIIGSSNPNHIKEAHDLFMVDNKRSDQHKPVLDEIISPTPALNSNYIS